MTVDQSGPGSIEPDEREAYGGQTTAFAEERQFSRHVGRFRERLADLANLQIQLMGKFSFRQRLRVVSRRHVTTPPLSRSATPVTTDIPVLSSNEDST
jgi:hypothetical protein